MRWWHNKKSHQVFFQARQLVKDGFLVEVSESSRKVRHVFLFTDLLLCAKMKKTAVGWVHLTFSSSSRVPKQRIYHIQAFECAPFKYPLFYDYVIHFAFHISTSAPDSETERMTPAPYKISCLFLSLQSRRRAFCSLTNKEKDQQAFCLWYFGEWRRVANRDGE